VGGYYPYYYRPYYYYYPQYVPSYYGEGYYPVQPTYGGPSVVAVAAPRPELPRFGVGLFAGAVNTTDNQQTNTGESDLGVLGRFRLTPGLIVEGELGKTTTNLNNVDNVRVDRRLGGSLLYEIGAYNRFAPYLLAGLGVQQAQVGGDYSTTQDYGEIGAGIRYAITDHFHITLDIRAGSRSTVSDPNSVMPVNTAARTITPPSAGSNQSEDYTRGRLAAILYF
jgi:opacity protein-like surface antigen